MERLPNETFEGYRERRKKENLDNKKRIREGILKMFPAGIFQKKDRQPTFKAKLISKAVGKRHEGESLAHFKERRKVCNAKRKLREAGGCYK